MDQFRFRKKKDKHLSSRNRAADDWNKLKEHVDGANTIDSWQWKLNRLWMGNDNSENRTERRAKEGKK